MKMEFKCKHGKIKIQYNGSATHEFALELMRPLFEKLLNTIED